MIRVCLVLAVLISAPICNAQSFSSDDLVRRTMERRAMEAASWGIPVVNYDRMLQEVEAAGGDFVPANAPASQYWSAVVHDRETHALIREVSSPSKSSLSEGLKTNADGTVDLYFRPKALAGRASNWTPTKVGGQFEVLFPLRTAEASVR